MPTRFMSVVFAAYPGLTTVGYQLYDASNVAVGSRVTAGIVELVSGQYGVAVTLSSGFVGSIDWDTGDDISNFGLSDPIHIREDINLTSEGVTPPVFGDLGSQPWTIVVTRPDAITPIENASVYVSTDEAGETRSPAKITSVFGQAAFMLDFGTFYVWASASGWVFDNPATIIVGTDTSPTTISATSAVNTAGGYPQLADLQTFLSDAEITGLSDTSLQFALDAAIERWEDETHFVPFFSDSAEEVTLLQNPPIGRYVELEKPFQSLSEVKTGITPSYSGTVRTQGIDFEYVYFRRGRVTCIQALDFGRLCGLPNSVSVTGVPGVTDTLPARVFQAILEEAARIALGMKKGGTSLVAAGGVKAITQGPIKTEYTTGAEGASNSTQTRTMAWATDWEDTVWAWGRRGENLGGGT